VVTQGNSATFSVTAAGSEPFTYRWRTNGVPLAGATNSSFTLASAQPSDAGSYDVVIANSSGSVTSTVATLTVLVPPVITQQPQSQTVLPGTNVTFTVVASGTEPLSYQWRFGVPGVGGGNLAGATGANLVVSNVSAANLGNYRVIVSNAAGVATSAVATLRVLIAPVITNVLSSSNTLSLSFPTLKLLNYTVERKDGLEAPGWTPPKRVMARNRQTRPPPSRLSKNSGRSRC
jgi:hypothetical protein